MLDERSQAILRDLFGKTGVPGARPAVPEEPGCQVAHCAVEVHVGYVPEWGCWLHVAAPSLLLRRLSLPNEELVAVAVAEALEHVDLVLQHR